MFYSFTTFLNKVCSLVDTLYNHLDTIFVNLRNEQTNEWIDKRTNKRINV